jgi:hypothetical protein
MENTENKLPQEEQEIDLLELVQKLWKRRKIFYKALGGALIVGLVIAFSIPKEYSVTVTLAPESTRRTSSSLASMAAMMGFGDLATSSERDALNILLFPDILASNPFALELYSMPVKPVGSDTIMALNEYISQAKRPWWSSVMGLPGKMVGGIISLFSSEDGVAKADTLNPFKLTKTETGKIGAIKKTMEANVDNKTGFTTITVTMQDAEVAATVADSVVTKLQDYVTTYRTKKAAGDCKYWEKLYKEKQQEYYEAQQKYANYVDENKSLFTQRSKIEGERLQNEMNLAFQIYNQMATQLQMAQGKLQEAKPVFAVVQPATVPLRPSAPRKMVILIGCLFLAFVGTAGWILFGEDIWKKLKNNSITEE